jgi:formylglycine-generating enzyme
MGRRCLCRGASTIALFGVVAFVCVVPVASASTVVAVKDAVLRARPSSRLPSGSPGTLVHAIAAQEKRVHHARRWKRQQAEGSIPDIDPNGVCPKEMGNVDGRLCVDRWEGTLVELGDDGGERPWPANFALDRAKRYRAVSASGVAPQAYISGEQAEAACRAANKRLCQSAEWRLACSGSEGLVYPYGTKHVEGRCNDHGRAPMYVFYPKVLYDWRHVTNTDMNDPRLNLMEGTLAKTGEHASCVNDWGLYDMVGNLHEWTADPKGTFQGGYYLDTRENGEGCAYRTTAHDFDYHDYSTGFRCCADLNSPADDLETAQD